MIILNILVNPRCIICFIYIILFILLNVFKNKFTDKKIIIWRLLFIIPIIIAIIQFIMQYAKYDVETQITLYIFLYINAILLGLIQFLYKKNKLFKISKVIMYILLFIGLFYTGFNDALIGRSHNYANYSYTESFKKTINILKKEYVLNDHKKIDYDYLYNKYYPLIEEAEKNNDELAFNKAIYEFVYEFKDGHFNLSYNYDYIGLVKNNPIQFYMDKYYGFNTVMLSDKTIIAILVDENSEAYQNGLRDGMVITKKDNVNIYDVLNNTISDKKYPVKESEDMYNTIFLFLQGNDKISVSFINDMNEEQTIEVNNYSVNDNNNYYLTSELMYTPYYDKDFNTIDNYTSKMLDDNTGYIMIWNEVYDLIKGELSYFYDFDYIRVLIEKKIEELKSQGMTNLILDLRSNNGGFQNEAASVASMFTDKNDVTYSKGQLFRNTRDSNKMKGIGKYKDMNVIALVNADTVSSGDLLTRYLSMCDNVKIAGITPSNNSAQAVGGYIKLNKGRLVITYPIVRNEDENGNIILDTDSTRESTIKLDYKIEINKDNYKDFYYKPELDNDGNMINGFKDAELAYVLSLIG